MNLVESFATMNVRSFRQRMSDRYGTPDGLPGRRVNSVEVHGAEVWVETDGGPAVFADGQWRTGGLGEGPQHLRPAVDPDRFPERAEVLSAAAGPDGRIWIVTSEGLFRSEGDAYAPYGPPASYLTKQPPVNTNARFSCVLVDGNASVWLGSNVGVFATDGANWWNILDRNAGLPYEDVTCLALGPDATLWVGTTEGVCRCAQGGVWEHYWGPRWLPDNRVNAIAVEPEGAAWVATDGGVARLYDTLVTLEQKAEHYDRITQSRHNRNGYVMSCRLKVPGDPSAGVIHRASDNDGLWTALHVAAQSFRWSVTRDPAARTAARQSLEALLDLVKYTGVPGFPARAIIRRGGEVDGYDAEETVRIAGELTKIWFQSPVEPEILCKGDTSSDELDGHYFAWSIYHDLLADAAEKEVIRETVQAVTDHLLEHNLTLVGHTGRTTRWGIYHPKYLNDDPLWWGDRGLNALSILAYLKLAEQICGHDRYRAAYRALIREHHYLLNTVTQKVAEPWWSVNHSDDQLAFLMYYVLLQRERDPATRLVLLQSLERTWKVERPEANPFFNFVFGACTGRFCDVEASVVTLQDWPWELIEWEMRGTHRHDVAVITHTGLARSRCQLAQVLPPGERRLMRWNGNPYQPDGGTPEGRTEEDGVAWLLAYWMGRYHRLIE
jgi:hypothetical protein